jgi:hypothetical protein
VHGPKLHVMPASAQAIGLALRELATNAAKYGALSSEAGRVDIRWGTDGDTFTMSWTEREGPPVSAPQRSGFGTVVMEAMAERTLNGKVELLYPPSGVTWRLICPTANVAEPLPGCPRWRACIVVLSRTGGSRPPDEPTEAPIYRRTLLQGRRALSRRRPNFLWS